MMNFNFFKNFRSFAKWIPAFTPRALFTTWWRAGMTVLLVVLLFPTFVQAHLAGQPPFFKLNGVYSALYDVPTSSFADFRLPQDKPPALYVVNEEVSFEIDTNSLPVPPEILAISTFDWDWGDGSDHSSGLQNRHSYEKAGSYFIEITAKTKDVALPQLIQSTLINILPTKDYVLPTAKILVNGVGTNDALLEDVKIDFGKDFELDSSATTPGTGKIVSYLWDLGDGKSKTGGEVTYKYGLEQYAFFPVLRVTDENGLFSDAFIQITNASESEIAIKEPLLSKNTFMEHRFLIVGSLVFILLIVGAVFVFGKKKR